MKMKSKPKSRSKMTRKSKKSTKQLGNISKQEKKFHRKVKNSIPLKKNPTIFQKPKKEEKEEKENIFDDDEMILPLDMIEEDEQFEDVKIISDDEGEDYEKIPRSTFNNKKTERILLPIKTDQGKLISQSTPIQLDQEDEEEEEEEEVFQPVTNEVPMNKSVSIVELIAERQKKLEETKQLIVSLCDLIMKNPYEEISSLKQLRDLLNLGDPLISMRIRKLTMLSLVELFRDIVPGYRIRSLKEQTKDQNVKNKKETLSKDVKAIRHFEQTLLKHYQYFLHFLEQCSKKNLSKNVSTSKIHLGQLAIESVCKLLKFLHHFNFRTNLISIVVQHLTNFDSTVQKCCCDCLEELLRNDQNGEISLEIVRFINRLLKTRSYAVEPRVLNIFLSLNIREISSIEEKQPKIDYRSQKLSRRDRRQHKEKQEVKKLLENQTLTERQTHRSKINRQILELIFLNYFRLLKRRLNLRLMPNVCEGLAKFGNLINLEYMDDLISCFYDELTNEQTGLNDRSKFHCLITIFSILNRQEIYLHIDPQRFYSLFYSLLISSTLDENLDLIIRLIQLMLIDRFKQLSKNKLLAFIKRLSTMILHLQSNLSIRAILVMIKGLLMISPMITEQLFDNEYSGSGVQYLPDLNDPEYCNAQNSTLFELTLLKTTSDRIIREQCEEILSGKFSTDFHIIRSCGEKALAHLQQ